MKPVKTIVLLMILATPAQSSDLSEPPLPYAETDVELKRLAELIRRMCEETGIPPAQCGGISPPPTTQEP